MGWKLCGDKKERGLVPCRDRFPGAGGAGAGGEGRGRRCAGGREGVSPQEYQHILYCVQTYNRNENKLEIHRDTFANKTAEGTVYELATRVVRVELLLSRLVAWSYDDVPKFSTCVLRFTEMRDSHKLLHRRSIRRVTPLNPFGYASERFILYVYIIYFS